MTTQHRAERKTTYCRICESLCGMVAEVQDGRLVALRPDKDHPLSAGFACQKGIAFTEVVDSTLLAVICFVNSLGLGIPSEVERT
jgi:anaerobic selenocysteine-containing dehydrogenase